MTSCQCSQCNVYTNSHSGVARLVRLGWAVTPTAAPLDGAEPSWLCPRCNTHAESATLTLPQPVVKPQRSTPHPLRVLVVDDQELVLRCTARLLSDFESVVAVISPAKALEMLKNDKQFDVVVSDVMMPEMSGPELYMRCHAHSPSTADRFIFASADPAAARTLIASAARNVGAARTPPLFPKPPPREVMVAAVCSAAAQRVPKSGTYSTVQGGIGEVRVSKYRG